MITNPIIPIWAMAIICIIIVLCKHKGIVSFIIQLMIAALLFGINLRPMRETEKNEVASNQVNVLFVIDNTLSMLAEDYTYGDANTRLDGVKKDCAHIMEDFPDAEFALMTFDYEARLDLPYTKDSRIILSAIESLESIGECSSNGTNFRDVEKAMAKVLDNDRGGVNIVFFISDGESDESKKVLEKFSELAEYIDGGAALGYGTSKGGRMKVGYSRYSDENYADYLYDYEKFEDAISRYDEDNMKTMAEAMEIEYVHMDKTSKVDDVLETLHDIKTDDELEKGKKKDYADIYQWFAIPLLGLLVVEMIYTRRRS